MAVSAGDLDVDVRRLSRDERREALARQVAMGVAAGRRVESHTDFNAVLVRGRRPNHLLHLLLTVFTFGFWAPVWVLVAVFGGEKREMVSVDEWGYASVQRL